MLEALQSARVAPIAVQQDAFARSRDQANALSGTERTVGDSEAELFGESLFDGGEKVSYRFYCSQEGSRNKGQGGCTNSRFITIGAILL